MAPSHDDPTRPEILEDAEAKKTRLILLWDGGTSSHWLERETVLTIGRAEECDARVDHASVSRRHAVVRGGDPPTVEDLGSSNGVRLCGVKIATGVRTPIFPGYVVELGSVLLVLKEAIADAPASATTPPAREPPDASEGPMAAVARLLDIVAKSDISVLLLGETGVGKTVAAEAIHSRSPRAARSLVRLNCAALPEPLLESELFGYERGAFTGAVQSKRGLLESADGGTAFLDEIGEMPLSLQAKLLSVLEGREVTRLGSLRPRSIDVRFVSATNRSLHELAAAGTFRQDLYFRLNGIPITLPPLRQRPAELPAFAARFLDQACARASRSPLKISDAAMTRLAGHTWPGNLRELKNTIARACVLATGDEVLVEHVLVDDPFVIRKTDPPPTSEEVTVPSSTDRATLRSQRDAFERQRIVEALAQCNGNQTKAAALLGTSRRALINRIEAFGLPRPRK